MAKKRTAKVPFKATVTGPLIGLTEYRTRYALILDEKSHLEPSFLEAGGDVALFDTKADARHWGREYSAAYSSRVVKVRVTVQELK